MLNRGFFITGTDTGVGKTVVAAAVIKALHVHGIRAGAMKPVETGCARSGGTLCPSDALFLKGLARMDDPLNHITPYCFELPLAPFVAAEMEGRDIDRSVITERFRALAARYPAVVVEGVGGILVPLKRDWYVLDLVRELSLPLIIVSRPSLGTLNHTLLTVRQAAQEGLEIAGVVINFSRPPDGTIAEETNAHILEKLMPVPLLGIFPHLPTLEAEVIEKTALRHLNVPLLLRYIRD